MSVSINGTNGLTFADSSTQTTAATGFGFKNRIINGAMGIAQRGTSFATPATGAYTLDRWLTTWSGAAPASIAQVAGPAGFRNALQITGAASNTQSVIYQRIESLNCSDLSGQTVTIQANIAVSTAQSVYWGLSYANTQDTFSSNTLISSGTWSATTTATTFTATITGLPAGATNGLQLAIAPNGGGAFTSGTLTITGVQLEKGSTATSFDYKPYGTELALCQRYYWKPEVFPGVGCGQSAAQVARIRAKTPVTMRAAQTISLVGQPNVYNGGSVGVLTSISQNWSTPDSIEFDATSNVGMVLYACVVVYNNQNGATVQASAEL